jgi:hypothetical protein
MSILLQGGTDLVVAYFTQDALYLFRSTRFGWYICVDIYLVNLKIIFFSCYEIILDSFLPKYSVKMFGTDLIGWIFSQILTFFRLALGKASSF